VHHAKTKKNARNGTLSKGVGPKDGCISSSLSHRGTGYFAEYGVTFEECLWKVSITVCNLSIEMGARGGMIAPDQKTFDF
jgi:3-isopropylmalate/(R)-2-methylmalate dehydratase large subunit